jgi:hypothetical protein
MSTKSILRHKPRYIQEGDQLMAEYPEVLLPFIEEFNQYLELAVLKSTAHFFDGEAYPLSDAPENALEHLFLRRLESLPDVNKAMAKANLEARLGCKRIAHRGAGAVKDSMDPKAMLAAPEPIFQLVAPMLDAHAQKLVARVSTSDFGIATQPTSLMAYNGNVQAFLRLHRVHCIDETNPEFLGGSDEIAFGGTAVHADGRVQALRSFMVHDDMDDGESKVYRPPYLIANYDIPPSPNTSRVSSC